jgi:hypothetical protein
MRRLDMAMQIRPTQASNVAVSFRTIVLQQQTCVFKDLWVLKVYAEAVIRLEEVGRGKVLVGLLGVVCQDDVVGLVSAMRARFCLVECSHTNGANMAGAVVAGSYRGMLDGGGANETDFGVGVVVVVLREDDLWYGRWSLVLLVGMC